MEQQEGEVSLWLYQEEQVQVAQFQLRHAVFWIFFFCTDVQRVRLRPVFCLVVEDLVERMEGVAGLGEVC